MATNPPRIAEHQRVHPVDVEAPPPPTAPLVPPHHPRSDQKAHQDPAHHQRQYPPLGPPPTRRPKAHRRSCCCRLLCYTLLALVLLAVALAVALAVLYAVFTPKLPSYAVDRLRVTAFSVDQNYTARATFDVTVTATNPNKGIGIFYESGSELDVLYSSYGLAEGTFPAFYQGHKNTTVLTVVLNGAAQLGSGAMSELQSQQQTGEVPLEFRGDVPVRVKVGALKLWKVTSRVKCGLVVDSLSASDQINIKSSSCKFSLKL